MRTVRNAVRDGAVRSAMILHANSLLLGWTRAIPYVGLKSANMQAGVHVGMAPSSSKHASKGKLQGCFSNL